jgi:hypothetical protein
MYEYYFAAYISLRHTYLTFFLVKQNWTSGILREEAALLDELGKWNFIYYRKFSLTKSC